VIRFPEQLSGFARYTGVVLVVLLAVAFAVWRPLAVAGPPMGDFSAYYSGGAVWERGEDPYSSSVWNVERYLPGIEPERKELLPYVGPPLGLPLWAGLSFAPYRSAVVIWGLALFLCILILVAVPARLSQRRLRGVDVLALLLYCAASGPFIDSVTLGQAALPAAASVDVAILYAARGKWIGAGSAAVIATIFKPNLALVLLATVRSAGICIAYAVAAIVAIVGNIEIMRGVPGVLHYLALLPQQTASERFYAYQFTPASIAYGLGLEPHVAIAIGGIIAIVAIAAVIAAINISKASLVDGAAIACTGYPFIVPYLHSTDFVIVLLPAFLVIFRARGIPWLVGACGLVLVSLEIFAMAQGRAGAIFGVAMSIVVPLEIAALSPALSWKLRLAPLVVAPFVLALALAAPQTHLPMWPAALPRHFEAAPGAPANATWRRELIASGLENERPWASLLRIVTLSGTLLVGIAMTATARERAD
jgi:hypothetical protein